MVTMASYGEHGAPVMNIVRVWLILSAYGDDGAATMCT